MILIMTLPTAQIPRRHSVWLAVILMAMPIPPATTQSFRSNSKRFGTSNMDIVIIGTERQVRTSVVDMHITAIGSLVGSSFFRLCSKHDLAWEHGSYPYIAKVEE
jgi:hypothetical protein